MSYAIQSPNGEELNRCYDEDRPIHDWYRFVLSFPPHLVRDYLDKFGIEKKQAVLDPFCGTGTTLVEAKKQGVSSIGLEANPVAQFAGHVKTAWEVNADELLRHAEAVAEEAGNIIQREQGKLHRLPRDQENLLIANSISPKPLSKTLVLLETIKRRHHPQFSRYEMLALAKQIVYSYSNLRFGPEVGVSRRRKEDINVIDPWMSQLNQMVWDIERYSHLEAVPSASHLLDSRNISNLTGLGTIDAVITSPPYPNEKDYSRTTRLESVLLGFLSNKKELQDIKRNLIRSNTRNVYKGDDDSIWVKSNQRVRQLAESIEKRRIGLGKNSGFEKLYHKVVLLYFGGMTRHFRELSSKLRPGAKLAYVVGDQASYFRIMIRTGQILAEIAEEVGYKVEDIHLFRTRLSTTTKEKLREEVVVLSWPGTT